jgi:hypothetical protein
VKIQFSERIIQNTIKLVINKLPIQPLDALCLFFFFIWTQCAFCKMQRFEMNTWFSFYSFFSFTFLFSFLELELTISCLLGRYFITGAMPPYFSSRMNSSDLIIGLCPQASFFFVLPLHIMSCFVSILIFYEDHRESRRSEQI